MRTARRWLVLVWLFLFNACWAETVTVVFRNGDRVTAELVSLDSTSVTITNGALGKLVLPFAQIASLEKKSGEKVTLPSAAPQKPPAKAAPTPTPKAAAPVSKPVKPKPPKRWNLNADLGTDLEFNQTDRELFYSHLKWTYGKDRFRNIIDYRSNYGRTDGVLSANDMNGSVRVELDVGKSKKTFMFNAVGAGYNQIQHIDATYDDTFGSGYKLITQGNLTLNISLGANYQKKYLSDGTAPDYKAVNPGEQLAWKISPKWSFDQKFDYYQRITGIGDYHLRFESNLRYLLSNNINLSLTAIDQYDTQPARGVSENDLLLRVTLGLKF